MWNVVNTSSKFIVCNFVCDIPCVRVSEEMSAGLLVLLRRADIELQDLRIVLEFEY